MNYKFLRLTGRLRPEGLRYRSGLVKNLPKMFFFTDRKKFADIFETISALPKNTAIIIREYDLSADQRLVFAQKVITVAKKKKLKVLVGKDYDLARKIGADGVHFSDRDQKVIAKNKNHKMLLSYSCHSSASIIKSKKLNADLVFYSPIFMSTSHPDQRPAGLCALRKFVMKSVVPVYALGGVNENNIKSLINAGVAGVGGISIFKMVRTYAKLRLALI